MTTFKKNFGLVFLCVIWGVNWVAIKYSLEGLKPFTSASFRFITASVILFGYVKWKRIPLRINRTEFKLLLWSAFLTYALDYGLIYWGEQYLSAGVTAILFSTFVLFTALFSNFIFKSEPFRLTQYAGLSIGFLGVLTIFYDQLVITRFNLIVILASLAILLSAACAAASMVIVKKYLYKTNPVVVSFHQQIIGTLMLILIGAAAENPGHIHLNGKIILAIVYMGAFASAIAFVIYYKLLREISAVSLSLTVYITPLVALVTDYFFYGQVLDLRSVIGMCVVFSGIWLSQLHTIRKRRLEKNENKI